MKVSQKSKGGEQASEAEDDGMILDSLDYRNEITKLDIPLKHKSDIQLADNSFEFASEDEVGDILSSFLGDWFINVCDRTRVNIFNTQLYIKMNNTPAAVYLSSST